MQEIGFFHVVTAVLIAAIFGAISHVIRAVFNLYPDKLSDSAVLNITVSNDYSLSDHLFGTEFNNYGYYELFSLKNLTLSVFFSAVAGFILMVFFPEFGFAIADLLDKTMIFLGEYLQERVEGIKVKYFS